jgi:hypothetical protein
MPADRYRWLAGDQLGSASLVTGESGARAIRNATSCCTPRWRSGGGTSSSARPSVTVSESLALDRSGILELFGLLAEELHAMGSIGELYLVGGAVICVVLDARPSTRDIDAVFRRTRELREAAARVAARRGIRADWLKHAVEGFLCPRGDFEPFLELPDLRVFVATAPYRLASNCASMRIGEGFHDEADVRFLLRALNIERFDSSSTASC